MSHAALASVVAGSSGTIQPASQLAGQAADLTSRRVLPVLPELAALLPEGGLREGTTLTVEGSRSLLLALLAATTQQGWVAVVGIPDLGVLAAADLGVQVGHLALVPQPGPDAADVVAALLDGFAIVAVATQAVLPAGQRGATLARRLSARARQRGAVLLPVGPWPAPDLQLRCVQTRWDGLSEGYGRLTGHEITVDMRGRGSASRPTRTSLRFPFEAPCESDDRSSTATTGATTVNFGQH